MTARDRSELPAASGTKRDHLTLTKDDASTSLSLSPSPNGGVENNATYQIDEGGVCGINSMTTLKAIAWLMGSVIATYPYRPYPYVLWRTVVFYHGICRAGMPAGS